MSEKTEKLGSVQEAFYAALNQSAKHVEQLRKSRLKSTAELPAITMGRATHIPEAPGSEPKEPERKRVRVRNSKLRITIPGLPRGNDFQAIMMLIDRLTRISQEDNGEIFCLGDASDRNGTPGFTCSGLQSFWTRAGKEPPKVRHTDAELDIILRLNPVAIFMEPARAPDSVDGYMRVILTDPHVCLLLRRCTNDSVQ